MITLEHVAITTTPDKFAETVKFYREVFGLKAVRETPEFVFLSDGQGGRIEVQAYGEPALPHPSHLAFGVPLEQFDALVASEGEPDRERRSSVLLQRPSRQSCAGCSTKEPPAAVSCGPSPFQTLRLPLRMPRPKSCARSPAWECASN